MRLTPRIKETAWDPAREPEISASWEKEVVYRFTARSARRKFVIDTPPPYPSGRPWHIGAAAQYSQIDMIARTGRMLGYEVFFPIGIDRNGLPVERFTEKQYGIRMQDTPREKFLELCRHALDDLEAEMLWILKTLGLSCDFPNYYRTDGESYRRFTQATFIELWKRGLVYQATNPGNYCWDCGTTIADAEIEYEERPANLVYMRFPIVGSDTGLMVASTRPELLCSCRAVIVNPDDNRYRHLQGKSALVPIYGQRVPVLAHPSARPEFGTGAVMVCSYGDYTDLQLFRQLGLQEVIAIDPRGRMTSNAGELAGRSIGEARELIIRRLHERGVTNRVDETQHRTPLCERCHTAIEIIPMEEYYVKQVEFLPQLQKLAQQMRFHPETHRQILLNWLDSITIDWPVSRRRYYGTEVPVWYCRRCNTPYVPEAGPYYQPWKGPPPSPCEKCGGSDFVGDPRTFDTWMDSSVSPLYITRYQLDSSYHRRTYPTTVRPQGKDIVRTWLHYSILRCWQLTGKAPFQDAWIGGMGLDEHGRAMHRHLGNVIDPIPMLKKYGADMFRYWSAQEASIGQDFRCSEERIAGSGKFLTKLWNIARYISSFPQPKKARLLPADRWLIAELSKLVDECLAGYRDLNFYLPATRLREFTWNIFAAHYLELVKPRAYGTGFRGSERRAAWYTLHTGLRTILLYLAPIAPFITDRVWRQLYGKRSIHLERFYRPHGRPRWLKKTQELLTFNSQVWNEKKARGLSLNEPITMPVPQSLKEFGADLGAMHRLKD